MDNRANNGPAGIKCPLVVENREVAQGFRSVQRRLLAADLKNDQKTLQPHDRSPQFRTLAGAATYQSFFDTRLIHIAAKQGLRENSMLPRDTWTNRGNRSRSVQPADSTKNVTRTSRSPSTRREWPSNRRDGTRAGRSVGRSTRQS